MTRATRRLTLLVLAFVAAAGLLAWCAWSSSLNPLVRAMEVGAVLLALSAGFCLHELYLRWLAAPPLRQQISDARYERALRVVQDRLDFDPEPEEIRAEAP